MFKLLSLNESTATERSPDFGRAIFPVRLRPPSINISIDSPACKSAAIYFKTNFTIFLFEFNKIPNVGRSDKRNLFVRRIHQGACEWKTRLNFAKTMTKSEYSNSLQLQYEGFGPRNSTTQKSPKCNPDGFDAEVDILLDARPRNKNLYAPPSVYCILFCT